MTKPSTSNSTITSAVEFWTGIRIRGGLLTAARTRGKRNYDADIEQRVVDALGLPGNHITSILLKKNSVSLEQFVDAVFSALEPWAILMTETLAMFAEAEASHGGDGIKIEIRLDEIGAGLRPYRSMLRFRTT